jgi:hypothetical protein
LAGFALLDALGDVLVWLAAGVAEFELHPASRLDATITLDKLTANDLPFFMSLCLP